MKMSPIGLEVSKMQTMIIFNNKNNEVILCGFGEFLFIEEKTVLVGIDVTVVIREDENEPKFVVDKNKKLKYYPEEQGE